MVPDLPFVLLFHPGSGAGLQAGAVPRSIQLQERGFEVQHCAEVPQLRNLARQRFIEPGAPSLVVLDGSLAGNCAAAACLRLSLSHIGVVALLAHCGDIQSIQMLQCGADVVHPRKASANLLAASLFRLWQRLDDGHRAPAAVPASAQSGNWSLAQQAWVLISPLGREVPLTTSERAFMRALFNAPRSQATHAELIAAINTNGASMNTASHARLGLLVSRLRGKFRQHGIALPLKSVHGRGYMFTAKADDVGRPHGPTP